MKRFNKILALVLSMTMMFGVVSICASAADTENAAYKVRFVDNDGNAITEVAKDGFANVIVSIKTNGYSNNFTFHGFYDVNKLVQIRYNGDKVVQNIGAKIGELQGRFGNTAVWADAPEDLKTLESDEIGNEAIYDWGAEGSVVMATHADSMYPPTFTDAQKAQYKGVYLTYTTGVLATKSCVKVNTEGEYKDIVRFRFMALEDTALNKDVFFLTDHSSFTNIYIDPNDVPLGNIKGQVNPIKVSNLTIEYANAGGSTEPTAVLTNVQEPKVQWKADADGVLRLRFEGKLTGITPTVGSDEKVTNIAKIGFKYSREDATLATGTLVETKTLYDFTASEAGTYKFCAIVEVPMTADIISGTTASDIHATAFITIGDNTSFASNIISTTIANEYSEGLTAGLTPFAA